MWALSPPHTPPSIYSSRSSQCSSRVKIIPHR
ncbi:hypothetical protein E2C01_068622 [Portunus trituberculatus]|uniref:Uncharacterized protein n=1 Tax=Portunus trituberculatus TaxID=210409 RepID=A0A5B7HX03_PORTR|nr:hypothetical protein [Portunus trituberculatus]